jgi:hypothetical protein
LRQAQGDYVGILDGDDRLLPHHLEAQLRALAENRDCRAVYGNVQFIDAEGRRTGVRDTAPLPSGDILEMVADGKMGLMRSMLMPLEEVEQAGWLDERFGIHDGYLMTLRLAQRLRFAYVAEPTVEYRIHPVSVSRVATRRARLHDLEAVYQEVLNAAAQLPPKESARIRAAWQWKLLKRRIRAEADEGRRVKALTRLLYGTVSHPANMRDSWQLARWILKA